MSIWYQGHKMDGSSTVGAIILYAGPKAPSGWIECDGRILQSRNTDGTPTEYSALFGVIGNKYGEGVESGSFKVPNMSERFAEGASDSNIGTSIAAGLPMPNLSVESKSRGSHTFTGNTITGSITSNNYSVIENRDDTTTASGAFSYSNASKKSCSGTSANANYAKQLNFSATPEGTIDKDVDSSTKAHSHTISVDTNNKGLYTGSSTVQPKSICLQYIIKYK